MQVRPLAGKPEFVVATETGHPPPAAQGGAGEAVLRDERAGRLPLHEDDHAGEGARLAARHAAPRHGAARGRRAGAGRDPAHGRDRLATPADPRADGARGGPARPRRATAPWSAGSAWSRRRVGRGRARSPTHAPDEAVLVGAAGTYRPDRAADRLGAGRVGGALRGHRRRRAERGRARLDGAGRDRAGRRRGPGAVGRGGVGGRARAAAAGEPPPGRRRGGDGGLRRRARRPAVRCPADRRPRHLERRRRPRPVALAAGARR